MKNLPTIIQVLAVILGIAIALWLLEDWSEASFQKNSLRVEKFCKELLGGTEHPLFADCWDEGYATFYPDYEESY